MPRSPCPRHRTRHDTEVIGGLVEHDDRRLALGHEPLFESIADVVIDGFPMKFACRVGPLFGQSGGASQLTGSGASQAPAIGELRP